MPTDVKNVSEVTENLIEIVQDNSDLKDVWIQGEILDIRPTRNRTLNFTIRDNSGKIECVIFIDRASLQENLPEAGYNVSVKGQIYIAKDMSKYRFMITEIEDPDTPLSTQPISVSTLTNTLETTLKVHSGEVQGEISDVYEAGTGWTNFQLKDATTGGTPSNIVECSLPPSIANTLPFPLREGEEISVKGEFKIFPVRNAYQIAINNTADINQVTDPLTERSTSCCNECRQQHDTDYELCSTCHYAQVNHEGIVVGAVMRYFDTPKFENFSTKREYEICFGAGGNIIGRADVVLLNSEGNPVAIAECKRIGYDGNDGIVQLKGYISPTLAQLGLFANNTDPYEWTFLKRNDERTRYDEISRSQFERALDVDPVLGIPPNQTRLELIRGNIIEAEVDAIVNAANSQLTRGSGVDGAIRDAGGGEIDSECREIIDLEGGCPPGRVVITTGGNLHARHVIHAVGPIWDGGEQHETATLARCYKNSLKIAAEKGIRSIAFSAISTGNFGYPIEQATPIALNTVKEFVEQAHQNNEMVPEHIQFVLFDEEFYDCYVKEFSTLGLGLSCFIG